MHILLPLFLSFIIQEPIFAGAMILKAYQNHLNPWTIHLLFSIATLIDIFIGYYIGLHLHKRFKDHKLTYYIKNKLRDFLVVVGKRGKIFGLIFFIPWFFPISALFISWIEISLIEAIIYIFIGEWVLWYGSEWLVILTTKTFVQDSKIALYLIIGLFVLLSITIKLAFKKIKKNLNSLLI